MVKIPVRVSRSLRCLTAAWNTHDSRERERLIRAACARGISVQSPFGERRGIRAQMEEIAQVRAQFPMLRTSGSVLGWHHHLLLSGWRTEFGGARPPLEGVDCYQFDPQGRISRIVSFSPVAFGGRAGRRAAGRRKKGGA